MVVGVTGVARCGRLVTGGTTVRVGEVVDDFTRSGLVAGGVVAGDACRACRAGAGAGVATREWDAPAWRCA